MAMDKPGLGLPSSFWTILFRMIFGALVVVLFAVVPLARLQQIWFMPLVGVGAATLANAVPGRPTDPPCCTDSYRLTLLPPAATALGTPDSSPLAVGGGIVFFPFLLASGLAGTFNAVAFGVATQMLGNGTFGLLGWLRKDPARIAWYALPYTVLPSLLGSLLATFGPATTDEAGIKRLFGCFALGVAAFVLRAAARGGVHALVAAREHGSAGMTVLSPNSSGAEGGGGGGGGDGGGSAVDAAAAMEAGGGAAPGGVASGGGMPRRNAVGAGAWLLVMLASVFGGWLVGNIGIGNAVVTFLSLVVLLGVDSQRAVPTAIIAGGWTSAFNGLIHLLVLRDVPTDLWLAVLPGVFCGASVAPHVHTALGPINMLRTFGVFLALSALHMLSH
jgi:uncharacterized membrane protein YfcA